ncbi:MAG: hypothetical protein FWJ93_10675 [Micromonosporaceae bacterium]
MLHFDLDLSAFSGVSSSVWRSSLGVENIRFGFDDAQRDFEIFVTQREQHAMAVIGVPPVDGDLRQETTVRGRPAVLHRYPAGPSAPSAVQTTWVLRWQPVDGLWVVIVARDGTDEIIRKVAEMLRLDRAQHCAQPFVADVVPPDTRLTECWVSIGAKGAGQNDGFGVWGSSGFTVANSRGSTLMVGFGPKTADLESLVGTKDEFRSNRTVGGTRRCGGPARTSGTCGSTAIRGGSTWA